MAITFPSLFSLVVNKEALVVELYDLVREERGGVGGGGGGGVGGWGFSSFL